MTAATTTRSSTRCCGTPTTTSWWRSANRLRHEGLLAGIGFAACLEPSGGNSSFEPLLNPKNATTTWMDSCRISVDLGGAISAAIHTTSAGQGHETMVRHRDRRGAGARSRAGPRGAARLDRVAAEQHAGRQPHGDHAGRRGLPCGRKAESPAWSRSQAHDLGDSARARGLPRRQRADSAAPSARRTWGELVTIAHRHFHKLPPGCEPGLSVAHIMQVPTGGGLPTAAGRVQMYPCYSFEFHLLLIAIDPDLGKPEIRRYVVGHDCGTVINPKIVRGMTLGGIAHGIGAALYEEFAYDAQGQLMAQNFMDYLLPSAHEIPEIEIVHHETPSPHTVFGQKGSGESGYLGAPARGRERCQRRVAAARHHGQQPADEGGPARRPDRGGEGENEVRRRAAIPDSSCPAQAGHPVTTDGAVNTGLPACAGNE